MLSLHINIPDDLQRELEALEQDYESFILEAVRQRLERLESEWQYTHECRTSCYASREFMPGEDDSDDNEPEWQTL